LFTVTLMLEVVTTPVEEIARTISVWLPFLTPVVSQYW
jgi:hypothetical protein